MTSLRFGVASRLVGGLTAITIFAIATSILAIFGFSRFQDGFQVIAELEMPSLVNAAELVRQSESIVANAPALGVAHSQQVRRTVGYRMEDQVAQFEALATKLFEAGIDPGDLEQLREFRSDLVANLERIDGLVERRLDADLEGDRTIRTVLGIGERLRTAEVTVGPESEDTSSNVSLWKTNAQEAVSLMLAGQTVRMPASLAQVRKASAAAFGRADAILKSLPGEVTAKVRPLHDDIRRLAVGEDSVFDARAKRIDLDRRVQGALSRNKVISDQFIAVVSNMFYVIQEGIRQRVDQYNTLISNSSRILAAISVLCVIGAGTIFLYINGSVVRRLKLLQGSMSAHVAGRTVEIPTTGSDEIADMARSLEFFVDAIERREQALRESEQRLVDAIESISEGFTLCDADDRLVLCNSRYREDLYPSIADTMVPGTQFEEILHRAAERGLIADAQGRVDDWVAQRMAQHRETGGPHLQQQSDDRWIQISERRTEDDGTVAVYTDVTELKRAEEQLLLAKEQAEAGSRAKSQFLANMSHELRTPLNAILGYTELITDSIYGEVPDKIRDVIGRVEHNGRHLLGLINDILDLSKIEAGQLTLMFNDYSMKAVVDTVMSVVESLASEKKLELKATVDPDLPVGRGDEQRITQVLLNLVGNAIKFTNTGEVAVRVSKSDGAFLVSVADTGPGIPETEQQSIFEEFRQADSSSTREKGGTGLGLAITKRLVEMHGGRLWVESTPGEGATFSFTLPVRAELQGEAT